MPAMRLLVLVLSLVMPSSVTVQASPRVSKKQPAVTGTYVMKLARKAGGTLLVKQLSPTKIEFELDCNRGAPSYNTGSARASIALTGGVAVYRPTEFGGFCVLKFEFKPSQVVVSQTGADFDCGFGNGVYCGGTYRLKSRKLPRFDDTK